MTSNIGESRFSQGTHAKSLQNSPEIRERKALVAVTVPSTFAVEPHFGFARKLPASFGQDRVEMVDVQMLPKELLAPLSASDVEGPPHQV